jgi:hypothetical protein
MKYMLISAATTKGNISKYTIMYCDSSVTQQYYITIISRIILFSLLENLFTSEIKLPISFDENFLNRNYK